MSNEYMSLFVEEAHENVDALVAGLLRLESEDVSSAGHTIKELFRFAHNVKGMAATVGLEAITVLAHRSEDLLDGYRRDNTKPDASTIDLFLAAADALSEMIEAVAAGNEPVPNNDLLAQLDGLIEPVEPTVAESTPVADPTQADGSSGILADAPKAAAATNRMIVQLVEGCALPGARAAIVLRSVSARTTIDSTHPPQAEIVSGGFTTFIIDIPTDADASAIIAAVTDITDVAAATMVVPDSNGTGVDEAESDSKPSAEPKSARSSSQRATVRVDVERLDDLMNLVGELVIGRGQLENHARRVFDSALTDTANLLTRTISDIYSAVARARMISLEATFDRMNRLVRDTARELGKEVQFTTEGAETELDRSLIDQVADPIVHLVRNALDHGIEESDERGPAKPPHGTISLKAHHEGNQVVIEVADDGRGIDSEKVASKAVELGLISSEEIESMDPKQLIDLVFLPGLSTRNVASTVSGRGVGMDVVRSSVANLGGSVDVGSTAGSGATFRIRLPQSLAVLETLLVSVADQTWAVPLADIDEIIDVTDGDISTVLGSPVVSLRGETIPLIHGREVLALQSAPHTPFPAVVVHTRGERKAISVDLLKEQSEVVVKPAPETLRSVEHVSGVTILSDGTVGLIVDVDSFASSSRTREGRGHLVVT